MILLIVKRNFVIILNFSLHFTFFYEACIKLTDHVTMGVHFKSVHLYVCNNTDFDMNSSRSR